MKKNPVVRVCLSLLFPLCVIPCTSPAVELSDLVNSSLQAQESSTSAPDENLQQKAFEGMAEMSLTGELQVVLNEKNSTPEMIQVDFPPTTVLKSANGDIDYERIAKQFLSTNSKAFHLNDPENELRIVNVLQDDNDNRHVRFQQMSHGLPVWGKEVAVHLNSDAAVFYFNGRYRPTIPYRKGLSPQPSLSETAAEAIIEEDLGHNGITVNEKRLLIHAEENPRLAYQFDVSLGFDQRWLYFVDAHTGEVIERIDQIVMIGSKLASGADAYGKKRSFSAYYSDNKYWMLDKSMPKPSPVASPGKKNVVHEFFNQMDSSVPLLSKSSNHHFTAVYDLKNKKSRAAAPAANSSHLDRGWDPYAMSAMHNALTVQKYYLDTFKRNGMDGKGMAAEIFIHYGVKQNSAFWNRKVLTFGDGDGELFSNFAQCLDISAHEMTHGVIQHTAGFIYKFQSGALNESFADVFASMIDRDDWLLGEDCTVIKPGFVRSLADPHLGLFKQTSKMSEYQKMDISKDHGGVHVNSGIPNHAAYLTAKSIGRKKTEQIYYRALSYYLLKDSQFVNARQALIQSATDIHGKGSKEVKAVKTAWNSVEVFEPKKVKKQYGQTVRADSGPVNIEEELLKILN